MEFRIRQEPLYSYMILILIGVIAIFFSLLIGRVTVPIQNASVLECLRALLVFICIMIPATATLAEKEIIIKFFDKNMTVTRTFLFGFKEKTASFSYDDIAEIACETQHSRNSMFFALKKYYIDLESETKNVDTYLRFDFSAFMRNLMTGNKCVASFYKGQNRELDDLLNKLKAELDELNAEPDDSDDSDDPQLKEQDFKAQFRTAVNPNYNAQDFKAQFRAAADPNYNTGEFKNNLRASAAPQFGSDSFKTKPFSFEPQSVKTYRPQDKTEKKEHSVIRNFLSMQIVILPFFLFFGVISYFIGGWDELSTSFFPILSAVLVASVAFAIVKTIAQNKGIVD